MSDEFTGADFTNTVPLRDYIEMQMRNAEQRGVLKDTLEYRALLAALAGLDKRLDGMNEFRKTIDDFVTRGISRTEVESLVRTVEAKIYGATGPLEEKLNAVSRTNWPLLGTFATLGFIITGGMWVVVGLKIEATNQPIGISVAASKSDIIQLNDRLRIVETASQESQSADSQSRADRSQLNARLTTVEQNVQANAGTLHNDAERTTARLVEIETQFRGASNVFNLQFDHIEQLQSLIYAKVFDSTLPNTVFRPELSSGAGK